VPGKGIGDGSQPSWTRGGIIVEIGDDRTARRLPARVAGDAEADPLLADVAQIRQRRELARHFGRGVVRRIVD
jgi:hypothetical protein